MDLDSLVAHESHLEEQFAHAATRSRWSLDMPDGINPQSYFACLMASTMLVVYLGFQITLTLLMWVKLPEALTAELTGVGVFNFRPEHDVAIYVVGLPLTLGLVAAHSWFWNRRLRRTAPALSTPGRAPVLGAIQAGVGLAASGIFVYEYTSAQQYALRGEPIPQVFYVLFALLGLVLVQAALSGPRKFASFALPPTPQTTGPRHFTLALDALFAMLIVLIVYVPSWDQLAGHIFQAERYFHWDFFAMGPALGFQHGAALGTEIFSFYGLGWPVLFALVSPFIELTYGSMIHLSAIYGCLYFIGIYVLLRLVTKRPIWAAAGTLLAVRVHMFSGLAFLSPLWRFPSVTVMRRPFDVWLFITLVMYIKDRKPRWLLGAATLTGLALWFETDTGIYLAAALGLFWIGVLIQSADRRRDTRLLGGSILLAGFVLGAGLLVASRGSLFSADFWHGWLENLKLTSAGYTLMPMVGEIGLYEGGGPVRGRHLALFFVVVAVFVAFIANLVIKLLHRRATPMELIVGSLAFYGFLSMIQFMGRTDPLNLYPVMIPFAVLVAIMASRLDGMALAAVRSRRLGGAAFKGAVARSSLGAISLAMVAVTLVSHDPFQRYPNMIRDALGNRALANESCLTDVPIDGRFLSSRGPACGATSTHDHERFVEEFPDLVSEIRRRGETGEMVAILDQDGPIFYQAADVAPWGKYTPLFPNLVTKERLSDVARDLRTAPPENVLIRSAGEYDLLYDDIQKTLFAAIEAGFYLDGKIGTFEVWRRQGLAPTEPVESART